MSGALKNSDEKLSGKRLVKAIEKVVEGLTFMSETDAPVTAFSGAAREGLSETEIRRLTGVPEDVPVEFRRFEDFFRRTVEVHEWSDDRARESAARFAALRSLLSENLGGLVCFRAGRIRIAVYVIGIDKKGNIAGIRTEAVET